MEINDIWLNTQYIRSIDKIKEWPYTEVDSFGQHIEKITYYFVISFDQNNEKKLYFEEKSQAETARKKLIKQMEKQNGT